MKNRILFRAERLDSEELVYGFYFYNSEYDKHYIMNDLESVEIIPETLGQLSNMLSRKAGEDIFVGDEIKFNLLEMIEEEPEILGLVSRVNTIEDSFIWYDKVKLKR